VERAIGNGDKRQRIYATGQFARTYVMSGDLMREPASVVHAKMMGVQLTACGLACWTWFRFYDRLFDGPHEDRCDDCLTALAGGIPDHWRRALDRADRDRARRAERARVLSFAITAEGGQWSWTLVSRNHRVLARSGRTFGTRVAAEESAIEFRRRADEVKVELVPCGGRFEWHMSARGRVMAQSRESRYSSRYDARAAIATVLTGAGAAELLFATTSAEAADGLDRDESRCERGGCPNGGEPRQRAV
jgi:uncharacterized protein YegP (UPF0339 family)